MNEMQKMMKSPDSMNQWTEDKRKEFESIQKMSKSTFHCFAQ